MHFAAATNESTDVIWSKIVHAVNGSLSAVICPNASSFITTKDGLECLVDYHPYNRFVVTKRCQKCENRILKNLIKISKEIKSIPNER